jgi:putative nucleotidyltransferase with HDIG domain
MGSGSRTFDGTGLIIVRCRQHRDASVWADFTFMKALPLSVEQLLAACHAPPRLKAHLTLVHDAAQSLTEEILAEWPDVRANKEAVLFGAATHDIGKVVHPDELQGPGHAHEEAGVQLLLQCGVTENLARFARTHGQWKDQEVDIEDLLVALADKVWKGKRDDTLEQRIADHIAARSGEEVWKVWLRMDELLCKLAASADERLYWQAGHPV